MKWWVGVLMMVGIVFILIVVINFEMKFSDHPGVVLRRGERYHILPESKLTEPVVLLGQNGEKYYVISESKLRLLGPKLLTGGE